MEAARQLRKSGSPVALAFPAKNHCRQVYFSNNALNFCTDLAALSFVMSSSSCIPPLIQRLMLGPAYAAGSCHLRCAKSDWLGRCGMSNSLWRRLSAAPRVRRWHIWSNCRQQTLLEIIGPTIAEVYVKVCSRTSMVKIGSAIRLD